LKLLPQGDHIVLSSRQPQPAPTISSAVLSQQPANATQQPVNQPNNAPGQNQLDGPNNPSPKPAPTTAPAEATIEHLKKGVLRLQLMENELQQLNRQIQIIKQTNPAQDVTQMEQTYAEKTKLKERLKVGLNAHKEQFVKMGMLPNMKPKPNPGTNAPTGPISASGTGTGAGETTQNAQLSALQRTPSGSGVANRPSPNVSSFNIPSILDIQTEL
jgi:hypothetical protein